MLSGGATIAATPSQAEHAALPRPLKNLGICCTRKGKTTAAALMEE